MPETASAGSASTVVEQFNAAFNRHDVDAIMDLMTDDCVFENTFPAPDGERHLGQEAVRACWVQLFQDSPAAHFDVEDSFATADRCAVRWRYSWRTPDDRTGYVRGIDLFEIRDGKVAAKYSYVKG